MKNLKLQTGDAVTWNIGLLKRQNLVGVVLEELENNLVSIVTRTKNGIPFNIDIEVDKSKLKLVI